MSMARHHLYIMDNNGAIEYNLSRGFGGRVKKNLEIIIGARIRLFRKEIGFTIEELAFKAQLHPNYLGDIERGMRNPSLKNLDKIANSLGKPLTAIFSINNHREDTMMGASKIREKYFDYPAKKYSENILSLIKSLMKNSEKDREYVIQTAKSLSNQLRKK